MDVLSAPFHSSLVHLLSFVIVSFDSALLTFRPLAPDDSISELTELLHRAYKRLADMGLRFVATYQAEDETRRRAESGTCYVGIYSGRIVATVTYYGPTYTGRTPWYMREDVAYFGQFAVEPELQGFGIGNRMLELVENHARNDGAAELALDTAEPAEHLIAYYTRHGYRFIEYVQWDATNYRSVVLSKRL